MESIACIKKGMNWYGIKGQQNRGKFNGRQSQEKVRLETSTFITLSRHEKTDLNKSLTFLRKLR